MTLSDASIDPLERPKYPAMIPGFLLSSPTNIVLP